MKQLSFSALQVLRVLLPSALLCATLTLLAGAAAMPGRSGAQTAGGPDAGLVQAIRAHQYAEASAEAKAALKLNSRQASTWFYLGLAENGLGHASEALEDLQHALALDPHMLQAAEAGAQIAYRQRDGRATNFLQDVLRADPNNTTAHAMLGVLLLEKADCAAALQQFSQSGSLAASDPATETRIRMCHASLSVDRGDLAAAEGELSALHQATPTDVSVATALASVLARQNRPKEAVSVLAPLAGSLSPAGLLLLAESQASAGDVPAAVATYRDTIGRAPHDENAYIDLAILSMEHQSPDVALSVLDAGLHANPESARLLVARGTIYAQVGKDDQAQADFERANRLAPSSTYGTLGMGVLLREDGNLHEAERVLDAKLKTAPANPLLSFMLADVLVREGASPGEPAFARAEQLLHLALHGDPSLAPAHALLGKLLLKDNQPEQAVVELEAAIKLQANDRTALNQLIAAYRRLGRTADAARVSATLEAGVANERAQENENNRIHLSLATPQSAAGQDTPGGPTGQNKSEAPQP